tara:strand:+ start:92 stop:532 length:441 start_codon:yes stop_codon:yes gene_type:complete
MLKKEFWKKKKLNELSKEEWEALCDRCGKCCVIKLEDVDSSKIYYTNVSCKLLCTKTANCKNYIDRKKIVKDCVVLSFNNLESLNWMPKTCSYKLVYEGKDLPSWHYLINGNFNKMLEEKKSVHNKVINEKKVSKNNLQDYINDWE